MASFDFVICNNCKRETYQGFGHCLYCGYDVVTNAQRQAPPAIVDSMPTTAAQYNAGHYRIVRAKSMLVPFVVLGIVGVLIAAWMAGNASAMPDASVLYYLKAFFLGGLVGALLFG
jgi:hypothetical protein